MNQTMTGLSIEIYSDVVCPWCYVGKRRLEQALDAVPEGHSAQVMWRPFQLNPTMPKAGLDRRVYLEAKFSGPGEMKGIQDRVAAAGLSVGLDFAFDRMERTPNTLDAHRLIWLARQEGRQDDVVEALFYAYFTEGRDIGQADTLMSIAVGAGLDSGQVTGSLQSEEVLKAVRLEETRGHQLGIRGVPYFILNGRTIVSGAQPVETFVSKIAQATS
ncbi:MAG TPA: DsbA family oxidoreductase [Nitrospira sp.]|jgi:predicted DsbA family dithiol-disulfide isomerase|nr:DsbA family oxidoreductase [Nitrospira sp.]